jgi:hypothetical protein
MLLEYASLSMNKATNIISSRPRSLHYRTESPQQHFTHQEEVMHLSPQGNMMLLSLGVVQEVMLQPLRQPNSVLKLPVLRNVDLSVEHV